jgi:hypothetical protein
MSKEKKKIYISGKITGLIFEDAFAKFREAEIHFLNLDYEVVNPMKLTHNHDKSWESYMKEDLKAMMDCDAIALLANHKDSKGALIEKELAIQLDFMVFCQYYLPSPLDDKVKIIFSQIN